jgi:hypothetical protein
MPKCGLGDRPVRIEQNASRSERHRRATNLKRTPKKDKRETRGAPWTWHKVRMRDPGENTSKIQTVFANLDSQYHESPKTTPLLSENNLSGIQVSLSVVAPELATSESFTTLPVQWNHD